MDCGCHSPERVGFPEYTLKVAWEMVSGNCECGIYTCGNGYAMAMLANRVPGMRATICHDAFTDTSLIQAPITWIMRFIGQALGTAQPL